MTSPAVTLDMVSNGPSRFLIRPLSANATQLHLPFGSWSPNTPYPGAIGPLVEIGEERLRMIAAVTTARTNTTLTAAASSGDTTITVADGSDIDASQATGVTNALLVGNGPTYQVTAVNRAGDQVTLSAPLAVALPSGAAVDFYNPGTTNYHLKEVITVTRSMPGLAHDSHSQVSKVFELSDFELTSHARDIYNLRVAVGDLPRLTAQVPRSVYGLGGTVILGTTAVSAGTIVDVVVVPPHAFTGFGAPAQCDVEVVRVADATGAILGTPSDWFSGGTVFVESSGSFQLTFDPAYGSASTADFEISAGSLRLITAGWYMIRAQVGAPTQT